MAYALHLDEARLLWELDEDDERIDTALGNAESASARAALLAERRWVERRRRALVRHAVSCIALLEAGDAPLAVHVRDVSAAGAGLELTHPPAVGTRVRLSFPTLDGTPALDAVVRHASPEDRRVGLQFVDAGGELACAVVDELVRAFRADP
jgi:hypothetical protein